MWATTKMLPLFCHLLLWLVLATLGRGSPLHAQRSPPPQLKLVCDESHYPSFYPHESAKQLCGQGNAGCVCSSEDDINCYDTGFGRPSFAGYQSFCMINCHCEEVEPAPTKNMGSWEDSDDESDDESIAHGLGSLASNLPASGAAGSSGGGSSVAGSSSRGSSIAGSSSGGFDTLNTCAWSEDPAGAAPKSCSHGTTGSNPTESTVDTVDTGNSNTAGTTGTTSQPDAVGHCKPVTCSSDADCKPDKVVSNANPQAKVADPGCSICAVLAVGMYITQQRCGKPLSGRSLEKRDQAILGCACNTTYVSAACCLGETGFVYEPPHLKIGELRPREDSEDLVLWRS
ncbi:MAG: hypothetical protein M1838_000711 [Thelocarpon superellum]|nr:MAG: hypothetical protein M1838_000711 [Thelocarpon superellum]